MIVLASFVNIDHVDVQLFSTLVLLLLILREAVNG